MQWAVLTVAHKPPPGCGKELLLEGTLKARVDADVRAR